MSARLLSALFLVLLVASVVPHTCVHDALSRNVKTVKAPATDGVARRVEVATAAPIRIAPLYRSSNGGTDISIETGMSP